MLQAASEHLVERVGLGPDAAGHDDHARTLERAPSAFALRRDCRVSSPGSLAPSSSGLGHHPLKVAARVRIPLGLLVYVLVRASQNRLELPSVNSIPRPSRAIRAVCVEFAAFATLIEVDDEAVETIRDLLVPRLRGPLITDRRRRCRMTEAGHHLFERGALLRGERASGVAQIVEPNTRDGDRFLRAVPCAH